MSKSKFTTIEAAQRLMTSMEIAINNMIDEIKKPVDPAIVTGKYSVPSIFIR